MWQAQDRAATLMNVAMGQLCPKFFFFAAMSLTCVTLILVGRWWLPERSVASM